MDIKTEREYAAPKEEPLLPQAINPPPRDELGVPDELGNSAELVFPPPEFTGAAYGDFIREEESKPKRSRKSLTRAILSMLTAISIAFVSLGLDPFGLSSAVSAGEAADSTFPILTNLSPNGSVPGWGVLDEEFILLETQTSSSFICAGAAYGQTDENGNFVPAALTEADGISYDEATNTLTLTDFTYDVLNINMMGNGFKLRLEGDNRLGHLLVWGFHYGGSILITGDGSLTVNKNPLYDIGILLRAEDSQTCLMVDKDVTLDIYGTTAAVFIEDTTMDKAIYYLNPLEMTGGERKKCSLETDGGEMPGYTVCDDGGVPSTHVKFSKPEQ